MERRCSSVEQTPSHMSPSILWYTNIENPKISTSKYFCYELFKAPRKNIRPTHKTRHAGHNRRRGTAVSFRIMRVKGIWFGFWILGLRVWLWGSRSGCPLLCRHSKGRRAHISFMPLSLFGVAGLRVRIRGLRFGVWGLGW